MTQLVKVQKAINLVTSQISHGMFPVGDNGEPHTVVVGYAPSIIRVICVADDGVDLIYWWYSTAPDKAVSLGSTLEYVASPITATEQGFILDLTDEEYPPDFVIWETYGYEPRPSTAPSEGDTYSMPAEGETDDEYV